VGAHQHVDLGRAVDHGRALELGDAASDADHERGPLALGPLQAAERVIELVGGFLADGAGVDEDDVGGVP
jgi:hypothetical protein